MPVWLTKAQVTPTPDGRPTQLTSADNARSSCRPGMQLSRPRLFTASAAAIGRTMAGMRSCSTPGGGPRPDRERVARRPALWRPQYREGDGSARTQPVSVTDARQEDLVLLTPTGRRPTVEA